MSAALLRSQRHALLNTIAANNAARADRVGRRMLDGLNAQMERYVRRIEGELSRGAQHPGIYGDNGWSPTLQSLIRDSQIQRELGLPHSRKAAA